MTTHVNGHVADSGHVRPRSPSQRRQRWWFAVAAVVGLGFVGGLLVVLTWGPKNGYYDCYNTGSPAGWRTRGQDPLTVTVRHGKVVDLPPAYRHPSSIDATFGSDAFTFTLMELGKYFGRGAVNQKLTLTCKPIDFEIH